ncbi:hypothetical protein COV15_00375 [Candidatus Woesearchaeota archaeon CG10_big_fil_rev_8_21_14_0_10_34_12]|nr:MAG: hypothetical protein COV15_00375 [Candidatus Woesearchaeota archaeon CG10_big_fil_rev_8_21_14_0_10_34_12]
MNKQAVSEIVSTVLLILITIIAISIVSVFLLPMIKDRLNEGASCFDVLDSLEIQSACYAGDEVQIGIMVKSDNLAGVAAVVSSISSSKRIDILNNKTNENIKPYNGNYGEILMLPGENEFKTYILKTGFEEFSKIELAPLVQTGKKIKTCEIESSLSLVEC